MKTAVIVFLVASVCIHCATPSKQNIRKKRAWIVDSLSMEEEHSGPFPYKLGDLNIEKTVMEEYFIHGQGIDKDPKGILSVKTNGSIYALGKVDYEQYKKLTITLTKENTNVAVDIVIQDVNDHAPVFNKEVYEITIDESTPQGEHLVTVLASDADQFGTANSLFTMKIISVSPQTSNTEFFIDQTEGDVIGKISFKGCLDYEETQKYTILVEAKDHGEKVQLSSTSTVIVNIIDKNNHLPEFTKTSAFTWVKAQRSGEPVYRLQVTDKDSRGSAAWRARYSLQGDEAQHFKIQTDPETNDGVITIAEPLNNEERSNLSLIATVENEEPFFYCRVTGRPKHGLWDVEHSRGRPSSTSMSLLFTVIRKDTSEPIVFVEIMKHVGVIERMETGRMLEAKKLSMCLSEKNTVITVYSLSFHFELMGDVEGKWKLHSNYGTTVRLIKESAVRAGDHELTLKISDSWGQFSLQTLSIHVCDCDVSANCHVHRAPTIQLNVTAIAAIVISILLLLGILLMACQIRGRENKSAMSSFHPLEAHDQSLSSDINEKHETDCMCFEPRG
ncbi:cadherin-like protein 26 isoform X2 [Ctenopharyngodon idella]|uniref:cadherin-like protein 26 isoform X2 n=1 Tax=Ctenopharyngodon idella TaxID=7959 RepID=UPI002231DEE3|nr:cadherin-like protein 26 isoform X2 [Ctenopharyngodon idella]